MTDFDRKPKKSVPEEAGNGQASQGDPLLELTRLFGTRNLTGQTRANEMGANETRKEGMETERESSRQELNKGWISGLSPQPAGISMTGSIFMGDYGAGSVMATLPASAPVKIMSDEAPEERPEWANAAGSYEESGLPFEPAAAQRPSGHDENSLETADWSRSGEDEIDPIAMGEVTWLPGSGEAGTAYTLSADEENYDDEQIFHALAGDLTAQGIEAVQNIVHEGEDRAPADPVVAQDPPEIATVDSRPHPPPAPSLPLSGFSGGYFGYGQSVQIGMGRETRSPPLHNQAPQDPQLREPVVHNHISPSPDHRVFAPVEEASQHSEAALHTPATSTAVHVEEAFSNVSSNNPEQALAETLHDFDLTIHREKRRRRTRSSPQSASGFPASVVIPPIPPLTPLEKTEEFDLPPIDYDTSSPLPVTNGFSDDFSVGIAADHIAGENHFFAKPLSQEAHNGQAMLPDEATQPSLYDWSVPAHERVKEVPKPASSRSALRGKKFYAFLLVVLLGLMGGGFYWLYDFYGAGNGDPVLINSLPGDVKIRPETNAQSRMGEQDMAVYNQDSADISQPSQGELLDGRETPVNLDQINTPLVVEEDETVNLANPSFVNSRGNVAPDIADRDFLDPVDASILAAIERSVPLHLVPTVAIERDGQGNLSPIEHRQEPDEIFIPASDYRTQILRQLEDGGRIGDENQIENEELSSQSLVAQTTNDVPMTNEGRRDLYDTTEQTSPDISSDLADLRASGEAAMVLPETEVEADVASPPDLDDASGLNPPAIIPEKPPAAARTGADIAAVTPATNPAVGTMVDERFYVQISSQPSRDAAIEEVAEVRRRFASLIGKNQVVIVPANIPGRGIYYRVRILVSERPAAVSLCERYQAAGGSCFVGS